MSNRAKPTRDPFTLSLGGLTTITSVVAAPAIAHDRINAGRPPRPIPTKADRGPKRRMRFPRFRRAV